MQSARLRRPLRLALGWLALAAGCAHATSADPFAPAAYTSEFTPTSAHAEVDALRGPAASFSDEAVYDGRVALADEAPSPTSRGGRSSPPPPPPVSAGASPPPTVAIDAPVHRASIIYTARFVLALYEVEATQRALAESAVEFGGFVASWQGNQLVVRVPAERFRAYLDRIEGAGRVVDRNLQAADVSDQFRDLEIRLQNLIAVRARLETLLAAATTVQQALEVERELERVTLEIESIRGRLRHLGDQVAYSTVTVLFQALPREQLAAPDAPTPVGIPFLRSLGLGRLLGTP